MKSTSHRLFLLAALAVWMYLCWPHLTEQAATTQQAWTELKNLSWDDRTAIEWRAGYRAVQEIARAVPSDGCVLILSRTGPQHMRYYESRFPYYLYPRRVRFSDHTDAPAEGCGYLAVFQDTPQNLAQEAFQGRWDEAELADRTARLTKVLAGERVVVFRQ